MYNTPLSSNKPHKSFVQRATNNSSKHNCRCDTSAPMHGRTLVMDLNILQKGFGIYVQFDFTQQKHVIATDTEQLRHDCTANTATDTEQRRHDCNARCPQTHTQHVQVFKQYV